MGMMIVSASGAAKGTCLSAVAVVRLGVVMDGPHARRMGRIL